MTKEELLKLESEGSLQGFFTKDQITNEVYHAAGSPGISKSGLTLFTKSPYHYKERYIDSVEQKQTKALTFGSMVHEAILEPELFHGKYASDAFILKECANTAKPRATKMYKGMLAEFKENNTDVTIVSTEDYNKCLAMVKAVKQNELASAMLSGKQGESEQSLYWQHNIMDREITCKCRIDRLVIEKKHIVELKTIEDASQFERDAAKYYYDMQAAWNTWGVEYLTNKMCDFTFILVEKENPSPEKIRFIRYSNTSLVKAEDIINKCLIKYAHCLGSGTWPGYRNESGAIGLETIDLPKWRK